MLISVLERRSEIGLRRALGATRAHIRLQFPTESLIFAGRGGAAGVDTGTPVQVSPEACEELPPGSAFGDPFGEEAVSTTSGSN
jgi:putative ABC transport system permease protein